MDCLQADGLAEAEALGGKPRIEECVLPECEGHSRMRDLWARRAGEVVLVLRRPDGRVILQTKSFYPPGAYRLPTGSIKPAEPLLDALQRELAEETGLVPEGVRFLGIVCYRFDLDGERQTRASYVFLLDADGHDMEPHDLSEGISGFREVAVEELPAVAEQLASLSGDWQAWGRCRAVVHRFVAEVLSCG